MAQMRAVLVKNGAGGINDLYLGEAPKPTLKKDEVLVKVIAFGLNRMDIMQREGKYPVPPGVSSILGVEFSGHVVEVDEGIEEWKVGDEVLGLAGGGAYAEYIAVPSRNLMPKPSHLSWVEAASIPENWLTAFQGLVVIGGVKAGESVLVHAGASGVGVAANQLARVYGATTVITTASTTEKLSWLSSIANGPTHTVNYKTENFAERVKEATQGKGVNVVIDFVGQSHWKGNVESLAVDGRMTMLALLSGVFFPFHDRERAEKLIGLRWTGSEVQSFDLRPLLYKRLHIEGSTLRARSAEYQADLIDRFKKEALDKITSSEGSGPLKTYISSVYPWTKIQDAHREMEENKNMGKIMVEIV